MVQVHWLNLGHWVFGAILIITAVIALGEARRGLAAEGWKRYLLPGIPIASLILFAFVFAVIGHTVKSGPLAHESDPMAAYHFTVGGAILAASLVEIVRRARGGKGLNVVYGLFLTTAGVVFLVHEQATSFLYVRHVLIAATLAGAGIAKTIAEWRETPSKRGLMTFGVLLLLSGLQFVIYNENLGAHEMGGGEHGGH